MKYVWGIEVGDHFENGLKALVTAVLSVSYGINLQIFILLSMLFLKKIAANSFGTNELKAKSVKQKI